MTPTRPIGSTVHPQARSPRSLWHPPAPEAKGGGPPPFGLSPNHEGFALLDHPAEQLDRIPGDDRRNLRTPLDGTLLIEMPPKRVPISSLAAPQQPLPWPWPLYFRAGPEHRLAGIEIWHDFEWVHIFPSKGNGNGKTQFRYGRQLALLVQREARIHAPTKIPALVLTVLDKADEGPHFTDTHYIVVVKIKEYLALAEANPAAAYFAHRIQAGITSAGRLRHIVSDPELFSALMREPDALEAFVAWARANTSKFSELAVALDKPTAIDGESVTPQEVIQTLLQIEHVDKEMLTAMATALKRCGDRASRVAVLESLSDDLQGLHAMSSVWGRRLAERLAEAHRTADHYDAMVRHPDTTETELQQFIEENPWLIGIEYTRVRARCPAPQGAMDFLLERYDGFHDLLELKSPKDQIIEITTDTADDGNGAPPPNAHRLSAGAAQALAQAHVYRRRLNHGSGVMKEVHRIENTWEPRLLIVLGCWERMSVDQRHILHELNRSFHRVEIVPYDRLADRARQILRNLDSYFQGEDVENNNAQRRPPAA